MADHHHHHNHRPNRITVPPRTTTISARNYSPYPLLSTTPTPTPSKSRLSSLSISSFKSNNNRSSVSFLFLLLFSLRSFYSLLPFLRSSPSFSLFPFSFLVSLLSFLLSLPFSLSSESKAYPFFQRKQNQPILSLSSISSSQRNLLLVKSLLLAIVFLLRFQAIRYCGAAAMILAELSGNAAARFVAESRKRELSDRTLNRFSKVRGFCVLFVGLFLLSISWDRIDCFPFSTSTVEKVGFSVFPKENCFRILPMLLPFLSGFLGSYEKISMNWGTVRQLGRKRVRLISLFYTTLLLFIPAVLSVVFFESDEDGFSLANLGWPLANTVIFGVLLSENYTDDKLMSSKDFRKELFVTFVCTIVLELFYFPELSLWGLLLCGFLLYVAVWDLDSVYSKYPEGELISSEESVTAVFMKPIRHILSERKSRKIALFLLINTAYMVVEFFAGFMSNSLGLISDACHMLFDCAALAIGLYASYISRFPANQQFNYGRGRFEVLSGYVNAVFLVLVGALIVLESIERILDPQEISTNSVLSVSIGGLVVNVVGLIFFHEEHHHAHGGSGCSHSRSHSDSHSQSHHHCESNGHDHQDCSKQQTGIAVLHDSHGKSCDLKVGDHAHECSNLHDHNHTQPQDHSHVHPHDHSHVHPHDHSHVQAHDHSHVHPDEHSHAHPHDHSHAHPHDHSHAHPHDHSHGHHHDHMHPHDEDHIHQHNLDRQGHLHHQHGGTSPSLGKTLTDSGSNGQGTHLSHNLDCGSHSSSAKIKPPSDIKEAQKHEHRHIDHNMEGIFLHVLADTLGSVGVVISTLLIKYKGWVVADPACSIFISLLIVSSVIPLLRNSAEILLQRVPRAHDQDLRKAIKRILKVKGVCAIQKLHVWSFTNTDVVGTLHLLISAETDKHSTKAQVSEMLHHAGVKDLTLQVECVR